VPGRGNWRCRRRCTIDAVDAVAVSRGHIYDVFVERCWALEPERLLGRWVRITGPLCSPAAERVVVRRGLGERHRQLLWFCLLCLRRAALWMSCMLTPIDALSGRADDTRSNTSIGVGQDSRRLPPTHLLSDSL